MAWVSVTRLSQIYYALVRWKGVFYGMLDLTMKAFWDRIQSLRRLMHFSTDADEVLRQALRLAWLRWFTVLLSFGLWVLEARWGVAPGLLADQLRLLLLVALLNLPLNLAYRWALEGRLALRRATQLAYLHSLTDVVFLLGAIHYTGGLRSPGDVLLVVYMAALALVYPPRSLLGLMAVAVGGYALLGLAYLQGWLPLYTSTGAIVPLSSPRAGLLQVTADLAFLVLIGSLVWVLSWEQRLAWARSEQERAYLELLYSLARAGLQQTTLQALAGYLAEHMAPLVQADGIYLTLWDEQRELPVPLAASGEQGKFYRSIQVLPGDRPNLTETVRRLGRAVVVPDTGCSPYLTPDIAARFPSRSLIAVPMYHHHGGRFLGAAIFAYNRLQRFTPEFLRRAERSTNLLALVLSRALTEEQLEHERRLLEQMLRLNIGLNQTHDPQVISRMVVEAAREMLRADKAACYVLDAQQHLVALYAHGLSQEYLDWVLAQYRNLPGARALDAGLVLVPDVEHYPMAEVVRPRARQEGYRAYAVAPLAVHGRLGGALALYWEYPHQFSPSETRVLQLLALHLGVALENAMLIARLEQEALTDKLTGLPNRRALERTLAREMERARRYRHPFAVLLIDLDGFKGVNDTYGHLAGDRVLRQMAQVFRETLRTTDFVARYGGDEFAVVLPEIDARGASRAAEKLRQAVEAQTWLGLPPQVRLSISVGLAEYPRDGQTPVTLLQVADARLYEAKSQRVLAPRGEGASELEEGTG